MSDELLSSQEKLAFVRSAIAKMAECTRPYLVSIVELEDSRQSGRHVGTGFRCILAGRHCVVTAHHVLAQAARSLDGMALTTDHGKPPWQLTTSEGILRLEEASGDLSIIPVPREYQERVPGTAYWPEDRIDCEEQQLDSDFLFIHGFPGSSSRFIPFEGGGIAYRSLPYGVMQRTEELPGEILPHEFAVDYDPQNMQQITGAQADLIDPRGLSGSACWRIGARGVPAAHWRPENSRLVGIVTRWDLDTKSLLLTSARSLVGLARSSWG